MRDARGRFAKAKPVDLKREATFLGLMEYVRSDEWIKEMHRQRDAHLRAFWAGTA